MAHTFLIFDFGSDEGAAQQARLKVEGWKQGFRLGNKLMVKFDRSEDAAEKDKKAAKQPVLLMVRLDFSDHEKLSHQRWIDRIPTENLFRDAKPKVVRPNDADFAGTAERFEALD